METSEIKEKRSLLLNAIHPQEGYRYPFEYVSGGNYGGLHQSDINDPPTQVYQFDDIEDIFIDGQRIEFEVCPKRKWWKFWKNI